MRQLSRSAAVIAATLALGPAAAQAAITGISIDPPFPDKNDAIHLTASGKGPLCALPMTATVTGSGTIRLSLVHCPDQPSPPVPFAQTAIVGPLPVGTYSVEAEDGTFTAPITVSDAPLSTLFDSLLLDNRRFLASVVWYTRIAAGRGGPEPLTDSSGYFWFFDPSNPEVLVKVIDGRAVNGHFWVFVGGLSDVGYTVVVTDLATGTVHAYDNAPGTIASQADTTTF